MKIEKTISKRIIICLLIIFNPIFCKSQDLPIGWEGFTNNTSSHCIILPRNVFPVINNEIIKNGDYIGAFFNSEGVLKCGGAAQYISDENISIFAYGNDPFVEDKNGFYSGDSIYWKVFSFKYGKEYDLRFIKFKEESFYDFSGNFMNLAVSVIDCLSSGHFTANAFVSHSEVCENENIVKLDCYPFGGSGNYAFKWKSTPDIITSKEQSFECSINQDMFFEVRITDDNLPHKQFALGYVSVFYISPPEVILSSDTNFCIHESFIELQPIISNYSSVQWFTNGNGFFENNFFPETKYFFGSFDIMLEEVGLTLKTTTLSPCYYSVIKTIKINLDEEKRIFAGDDIIIFEGESVELSGKISCFEKYEISWQPETLLYSNDILNPVSVPLFSDTDFVLHVTDLQSGITLQDQVSIKVIPYTSINNEIKTFQLYPNPFTNYLNVKSLENTTLHIFNLHGKLILTEKINKETIFINTNDFPQGVYIVVVFNDKRKEYIKIIKAY